MSIASGLPPSRRPPRHVPTAAVIVPWILSVATITIYAVHQPHTMPGFVVMAFTDFGFVGFGCSALTAWLMQRSTIDPYNDAIKTYEHVYDAGYTRGRSDERAESPGLALVHHLGGYAQDTAGAEAGEPEADAEQGGQTGT